MREIASTEHYQVVYDEDKNRVLVQVTGDLVVKAHFENFIDEFRSACNMASSGFTCLVDFSRIGVMALPEIIAQAQAVVMEAKPRRVASVWGEVMLARLKADQLAKEGAVSDQYIDVRRTFGDRAEAEAWLDEV